MHRKQASIASQVVPQPLILSSMSRQEIINNIAAAARSPASSNSLQRQSSLVKRDSAVSLGQAGSRSNVRRPSLRRSFSSSEAAFVEDDLAAFLAEQPEQPKQPSGNMGPVYRLVCWQSIVPFSALSSSSSTAHSLNESTTMMRAHHRVYLPTRRLSMLAPSRRKAVASNFEGTKSLPSGSAIESRYLRQRPKLFAIG